MPLDKTTPQPVCARPGSIPIMMRAAAMPSSQTNICSYNSTKKRGHAAPFYSVANLKILKPYGSKVLKPFVKGFVADSVLHLACFFLGHLDAKTNFFHAGNG